MHISKLSILRETHDPTWTFFWLRINQGQEFVIGGYAVGGTTFDALVFGYYKGKDLIYAARTRYGFTPSSRATLMKTLRPLQIPDCPFTNLPETKRADGAKDSPGRR